MTAETLRRAAARMRERAEAARTSLSDNVPEWHSVDALTGDGKTTGDAEHIASWHPAVALAVADLLDRLDCRCHPADDDSGHCIPSQAFAVARAYLGESA